MMTDKWEVREDVEAAETCGREWATWQVHIPTLRRLLDAAEERDQLRRMLVVLDTPEKLEDAEARVAEARQERDALVARFTEIAPCNPGDLPFLIAARALAVHGALRARAERLEKALKEIFELCYRQEEICSFEGNSMIYISTAQDIADIADAALATLEAVQREQEDGK